MSLASPLVNAPFEFLSGHYTMSASVYQSTLHFHSCLLKQPWRSQYYLAQVKTHEVHKASLWRHFGNPHGKFGGFSDSQFQKSGCNRESVIVYSKKNVGRGDFSPPREEAEVMEVPEAVSGSSAEFPTSIGYESDEFSESENIESGKGSLMGAIALITGTTVGAGILALPASTSPAGFIPSTTTMVASWAFLVVEAFLMTEVNVSLMEKHTRDGSSSKHSDVLSLTTMAKETMGPSGATAVTATYILLANTLMVAYITKSAEILTFLDDGTLPEWFGGFLFTALMGSMLYFGNSKAVDFINRILTASLLGLFVVIVVGGFSVADLSQLEFSDWTQTHNVIPIVFLSLVYHDLIPVICAYLDGNLPLIRKALVFGSLIPLLMFISWTAVALSIADVSAGSDPIQTFIELDGGGMTLVIKLFSLLAVATSFIGSTIGLFEFFSEQFGESLSKLLPEPGTALSQAKCSSSSDEASGRNGERDDVDTEAKNESLKPILFSFVILPPLLISVAHPDSFFTAANIAGSYGMTTLFGVLPPIMYWKLHEKKGKERESNVNKNMEERKSALPPPLSNILQSVDGFSFKDLGLATVGVCACGIIAQQVLLDIAPMLESDTYNNVAATAAATAGTTTSITTATPVFVVNDPKPMDSIDCTNSIEFL